MNNRFFCLLTLFFILSCETKEELIFEPLSISKKECQDCSFVTINVPKAIGNSKLANAINIAISEEIISWLSFNETGKANNIKEGIDAFITDYNELKNKYPEESMPWEATINGDIVFDNGQILTIQLKSYLFTGGAHGINSVRFLNFDKLNATELYREELFTSIETITSYAEEAFRTQEHIPKEADINSTGFMFETETYYLPENIGYTDDGLLLYYEPYEIASYADGPITLLLPYKEVNSYLKLAVTP
ncbi:DUF3298 and DUF4163 domain-containing protein [Maribacter confluentis]|uniref:DUF3298 and DUF4163 domain-containing protein n=1 Tax=Maribacter confluentis TaxID=1656093 RepID=A0ABT8RP55_9FLAO|nr:DUF3298 and DUF4163 domain-containing protein [Maribacter confluentis]MDO1512658.1 DUF3298 and DUF4163 domain-containing protein [Maribacter confluentis]